MLRVGQRDKKCDRLVQGLRMYRKKSDTAAACWALKDIVMLLCSRDRPRFLRTARPEPFQWQSDFTAKH